MDIESELGEKHFRVAVFGSARIKEHDPLYDEIYKLSKLIAAEGIDVVTGGGPGLMHAANKGHKDALKKFHSIGLPIKLASEEKSNEHLDIKKEFDRFSKRLDHFMLLSNAVVVAPGGVGTLLELFYTWQLVQVKHICNTPIILFGEMWPDMINWLQKWPLERNYLSLEDLKLLYYTRDSETAMKIIREAYENFKKDGGEFCLNYKKHRLV